MLLDHSSGEGKMIFKAVTILVIATACCGLPVEEAPKPEISPLPTTDKSPENAPTKELTVVPVEKKPLKPELVVENIPLVQPMLIPVPADEKMPAKPAESDLKTDSSLWWNSYYRYPSYSRYYHHYKYVPRTYSYYEPVIYNYWGSYW